MPDDQPSSEQPERIGPDTREGSENKRRERVRRAIDAVTVHRTHEGRSDDEYRSEVPPHH